MRLLLAGVLFLLAIQVSAQRPDRPFTDPRDGHTYSTAVIGSTRWMSHNLVWNSPGSFPFKDSTQGRYYPLEERDTACPSGWRLPLQIEIDSLVNALIPDAVWDTLSFDSTFWFITNGVRLQNHPAYPLEPTGWKQGAWIRNEDTITWWTAVDDGSDPRWHVHLGTDARDGTEGYVRHAHSHHIYGPRRKRRRFAIRCVQTID